MRNAPTTLAVPLPTSDPALTAVADRIWARSAAVDAAAAFPTQDIADLADSHWLAAAHDIRGAASLPWLAAVGAASLTVGRLFEGHLNAVQLAARGSHAASVILRAETCTGRISGVWNAEGDGGLKAVRVPGGYSVSGRKIHCSGAGAIRRPVVTAKVDDDWLMLLPDTADPGVSVDLSVWQASGMRGTATGTVTFDKVVVADAAVIGAPGDYYRSPWFSGGAWRVLAVQLGGLNRIMELHAGRLRDDPVARARFATAAGAHEAARLMVSEAARRAETPGGESEAIDAYVDLARGSFESLALTIVEMTRRNAGLSSFIAPDPLDRCLRDLETYLRQPFLDISRDHATRWLAVHGGRFT